MKPTTIILAAVGVVAAIVIVNALKPQPVTSAQVAGGLLEKAGSSIFSWFTKKGSGSTPSTDPNYVSADDSDDEKNY